jgi:hypothetical protein
MLATSSFLWSAVAIVPCIRVLRRSRPGLHCTALDMSPPSIHSIRHQLFDYLHRTGRARDSLSGPAHIKPVEVITRTSPTRQKRPLCNRKKRAEHPPAAPPFASIVHLRRCLVSDSILPQPHIYSMMNRGATTPITARCDVSASSDKR